MSVHKDILYKAVWSTTMLQMYNSRTAKQGYKREYQSA